MKALVLAGAELRSAGRLRALAAEAELVIAADSGLRHAEPLGVRPHLFVGDMDSVTAEALAAWPELPRERHDPDKDELDLELAAEAAVRRGATQLRILGVSGDRFDQTLAAALIAARLRQRGLRVSLHDAEHDVYALGAGDAHRGDLPDGTCFSLLALDGEVVVDVAAARYPLQGSRLPFGVGLGLSNRAAPGGPEVRVRSGTLLLIVQWEV